MMGKRRRKSQSIAIVSIVLMMKIGTSMSKESREARQLKKRHVADTDLIRNILTVLKAIPRAKNNVSHLPNPFGKLIKSIQMMMTRLLKTFTMISEMLKMTTTQV